MFRRPPRSTRTDPDFPYPRLFGSHLGTARRAGRKGTGVEALVQEYSVPSQEGVALMCLAEALLRIPDNDTRDALIRDKIADGRWSGHLGNGDRKSTRLNSSH